MSSHDPDHYKVGGIESIDVIRAKLTPEQFEGFCLGNAMKYVHRAGHKGSKADDIKKAIVYLEWAGEALDGVPGKADFGWRTIKASDCSPGDRVIDDEGTSGICISTPDGNRFQIAGFPAEKHAIFVDAKMEREQETP